jgi:tetratricopeptide (TPR) repeat protein
MSRNLFRFATGACVALCVVVTDAAAWGPSAQRAITETAIKLIRQDYTNAFKSEDSEYFNDVLRGAQDGHEALRGAELLNNERLAIERIGTEMQLLRTIRKQGTGSFFAYRMGVLSALVSDLVLPMGLADSPRYARIREQMEVDIDRHLRGYAFQPIRDPLRSIRFPQEYFKSYRSFNDDALIIIAADYTSGAGYNGYMKQAGPKFFRDSVRAVLDTWHTIIESNSNVYDSDPSAEAQTWYRVDEIAYQLKVKNNSRQANNAYTYFSTVNPGIMEAYEAVGDLFYDFGEKQQGVREWEYALQFPGAGRNRIIDKLSEHHINVGRAALADAQQDASARDLELSRALRAFEKALQYKRTSQEAVDMISQTNATIREREEHRELIMGIMSGAQEVMQQAQAAEETQDYSNAIETYYTAIQLYGGVDNEFPEQKELAESSTRTANSQIRGIISNLLDKANEAIADGQNAQDEQNWEEARQQYQRVATILDPVPDDVSSTHGKEKQDLLSKAEERLAQLEIEKKRWEEQMQNQPGQPGTAPA